MAHGSPVSRCRHSCISAIYVRKEVLLDLVTARDRHVGGCTGLLSPEVVADLQCQNRPRDLTQDSTKIQRLQGNDCAHEPSVRLRGKLMNERD